MKTPFGVAIFVVWRFGWRFPALRTSASTLYRTPPVDVVSMNYNYRVVTITEGAISHNYFSVGSILNFFPNDVIGGANRSKSAERNVKIFWGAGNPVRSDIARDKNFFRERSWAKNFYDAHKISDGDKVVVERVSTYEYHIYPKRG